MLHNCSIKRSASLEVTHMQAASAPVCPSLAHLLYVKGTRTRDSKLFLVGRYNGYWGQHKMGSYPSTAPQKAVARVLCVTLPICSQTRGPSSVLCAMTLGNSEWCAPSFTWAASSSSAELIFRSSAMKEVGGKTASMRVLPAALSNFQGGGV